MANAHGSEFAEVYWRHAVAQRRKAFGQVFARAKVQGELPADLDTGLVIDLEAVLAEPTQVETVPVNASTDAADVQTPRVLVAMLWIGSLIATLARWRGLHRKDSAPAGFPGGQLIVIAALAVIQPLSIVAVGNWLLGMDINLTAALSGALALTTALFPCSGAPCFTGSGRAAGRS